MSQYENLLARIAAVEERALPKYKDTDQVPDWAKDAVTYALGKGILRGNSADLDLSYSDLKAIVYDYRRNADTK